MIDLQAAHARLTGATPLAPLTLRLDAGAHALVGGAWDGGPTVLALCAGRLTLRSGLRRVLDADAGSANVRARVAYVPFVPSLPEPMRVGEVFRLAASLRGETARDASARLGVLGVSSLVDREVRSLARDERRAVALAEAVTSEARVLLIEEPFVGIDPRVAPLLVDTLAARATQGVCVVIATASLGDARAVADDLLLFDRGVLVRRAPATLRLLLAGPRGASVRVVASDTRRLAAGLAGDESVRDVSFEADVLIVRGPDAVALAAALGRAALRTDVIVESITADLLHDLELRGALAHEAAARLEGRTANEAPPASSTWSPDGART